MSQRTGFFLNSNSYRERARDYIGNLFAIDLLEELVSNREDFHPSNKLLSQRLRKSLATVKRGLLHLQNLGLIVRTGKPTFHGHRRQITVPEDVRRWVTEGVAPDWINDNKNYDKKLTLSEPQGLTNEPLNEYLKEASSEEIPPIQKVHKKLIFEPSKGNQLPKYIKEEEGHAYARPLLPSSFSEKSLIDILEGLPLSAGSKKSLARRAAQQQVLPRALAALADKAMGQCTAKGSWNFLGAYLGKMLADGDYERAMAGVRKEAAYKYLSGFEAYLRCNRAISCHVRDLARRSYSC